MAIILVIEDSEDLRNDIVEMLSLEGFDTIQANNGQLGIEMASLHEPDLIVCDVRMPIMDGFGVLDYVRSQEQTTNIPFIFLTARTTHEDIRGGMEQGADDYLTKPFTAEELIASIHTRLARSTSFQKETKRQLDHLRKSISLALPHELRTPLNAILGFSEILVSDVDNLTSEQIIEMSTHINQASMRLYRLVENYVVYANLEILGSDDKRSHQLRHGRVQYAAIIIEQLAYEKAIQYNREQDLTISIPENYGTLSIDSENFSRIVQEIVDNAFKFSSIGDAVHIEVFTTDKDLNLIISDNGRGMSPQEVQSVGAYMQFERAFFEQQGVGFGLAIAQRMTEIHDGKFIITSTSEVGTKISITLPFSDDEPI